MRLNLILLFALIALLLGIYTGVIRIGEPLPSGKLLPIAHHGILMAGSFLGTLFCLNQIKESSRRWPWLILLLMVLAVPGLLLENGKIALYFYLVASFAFFGFTVIQWRDSKSFKRFLFVIGAFFQISAYLILLGTNSYPSAFAGWLLFFVLTILGQKLPSTKLPRNSFYEICFWVGLLLLSAFFYHSGLKVAMGISMVGIAQWLIRREDYAWLRSSNIDFKSLSLLLAYIWLMVSGVLSVIKSGNPNHYDAVLHSLFIGTAFTTLGAGLIPGGAQNKIAKSILFLGLIGIHATLFIRIYGDIVENFSLRKFGGVYNGVFLLVYVFAMVVLLFKNKVNEKSN